jgi:hypothetical protein
MINSGLIFEMLSYSFIESLFHRDLERAKIYHGLMHEHFHSESFLYKEAVVFNHLIHAKTMTKNGAKKKLREALEFLPAGDAVGPEYARLINALKRTKVLQEIEDTFMNIDSEYNNVFSNINVVLEAHQLGIQSEQTTEKLYKHLTQKKVGMVKKYNRFFNDKMKLVAMSMKQDLDPTEEQFILEALESDKPFSEFMIDEFEMIDAKLRERVEVISELGTLGKIGVGAAVVSLIVKKLDEIKQALMKQTKEIVHSVKSIQKESYFEVLTDCKDLLEEADKIIKKVKKDS